MTKTYDSTDVKNNKKGWYLTTETTTEQERINLADFIPNDNKSVTITANSTYTSNLNVIHTARYNNNTIIAKNSAYDIYLEGFGNNKVTSGDYDDSVHVTTNSKNNINLGNGKNFFGVAGTNSNNTIIAGVGDDKVQ